MYTFLKTTTDLVDLDVVDLVDAHNEHVPAEEREQPLLFIIGGVSILG